MKHCIDIFKLNILNFSRLSIRETRTAMIWYSQYNINRADIWKGRAPSIIWCYILCVCLSYEDINKYRLNLELRWLNGSAVELK
jgi:hypothetical protein